LKIVGEVANTDSKVRFKDSNGKVVEMSAKSYLLQLSAKKVYQVAMNAENQKVLDAFLIVVDSKNKLVAADDDSGGGLNALVSFSPPEDGTYKVFAAALAGQGKFVLFISETELAKGQLPPNLINSLRALQHEIDGHV